MSTSGAQRLGEALRWRMPRLEALRLDGNGIGALGLRALAEPVRMLNGSMKVLTLGGSGFDTAAKWQEALPHLQNMLMSLRKLERLDLSSNFIDGRLGSVLGELGALETLDLNGISSDFRDWEVLCKGLSQGSPKLAALSFHDAKMPPQQLTKTISALAGKSSLELLDAEGNEYLTGVLLQVLDRIGGRPFESLQILRGGFSLTDVQALLPELPGVRLE
eukprot:SRR837773.3270.p2 GENE.SRR837773.3270~~SRR837773.3270.p2  ORF type:complete len:219 (-),score=51.21 SRR837773.3270:53-709(-)